MPDRIRPRFSPPVSVLLGVGAALAFRVLVLTTGAPTLPSPSSFVALSTHTAPGCARRVQARLFFGLHGPKRHVSDSEWEIFLAEVVTPRFPGGLTVVQASGQWRGSDDRVQQEPSRIVEIMHDESPDAARRIDEIVTIYKTHYEQESVMVARARIEVCF